MASQAKTRTLRRSHHHQVGGINCATCSPPWLATSAHPLWPSGHAACSALTAIVAIVFLAHYAFVAFFKGEAAGAPGRGYCDLYPNDILGPQAGSGSLVSFGCSCIFSSLKPSWIGTFGSVAGSSYLTGHLSDHTIGYTLVGNSIFSSCVGSCSLGCIGALGSFVGSSYLIGYLIGYTFFVGYLPGPQLVLSASTRTYPLACVGRVS